MDLHGQARRRGASLMASVNRLSIVISSVIILIVQLISIFIMTLFMIDNLNSSTEATADELSSVLVVPLYNVDDAQVLRITDTLVSSGRIAGIRLESTVTGLLVDRAPPQTYSWIRSETRDIEYRGIALGRLEIYPSLSMLEDVVRGILVIMLVVIGAVISVNVLANSILFKKRVQSVLGDLIAGLGRISQGDYKLSLSRSGYDDMDSIIGVINEMSQNIRAKNELLTEANIMLERRVAERTRELETALREQELLQEKLVESSRLTALGQLSAGIAHELNTPLGAIQSSSHSLLRFFDEIMPSLSAFCADLSPSERALHDKLVEAGLSESRKPGTLSPGRKALREIASSLERAGIGDPEEMADEIADMGLSDSLPLIIPLLGTGRDREILRVAAETAIARRMVGIIDESSMKGASVISALRSYLSPQADDSDGIVDMGADIERVLTLMHNMLKHGVEVRSRLLPLKVRGSPDKLSQVWMNIIRNAAQAMEFRGELAIDMEAREGRAIIRFADSGPGIAPEIRGRIFQPFFTTKRHGDGIGLGLDLCKKIVGSHKGTIDFESEPGRTVFIVSLPATAEA